MLNYPKQNSLYKEKTMIKRLTVFLLLTSQTYLSKCGDTVGSTERIIELPGDERIPLPGTNCYAVPKRNSTGKIHTFAIYNLKIPKKGSAALFGGERIYTENDPERPWVRQIVIETMKGQVFWRFDIKHGRPIFESIEHRNKEA